MKTIRTVSAAMLPAVMLLCAPGLSPVVADVSYRETVSAGGQTATSGGGLTVLDVRISGSHYRRDVSGKADSYVRALGRIGSDAPSEIVTLERGAFYLVDPARKTVVKETTAERRARVERLSARRPAPLEFTDIKVDIAPGAGREVIAELPCEQVIVSVSGNVAEKGSDSSQPVLLQGVLWTTSSFPGRSEVEKFRAELRQALGFDALAAEGGSLLDPKYEGVYREWVKAAAQVGGFPMRTTLTLSGVMGGAKVPMAAAGEAPPADGVPARPTLAPLEMRGARGRAGLPRRTDATPPGGDQPAAAPRPGPALWFHNREIGKLSTDAIDGSVFSLPEGYKRLVPKSRREAAVEEPAK